MPPKRQKTKKDDQAVADADTYSAPSSPIGDAHASPSAKPTARQRGRQQLPARGGKNEINPTSPSEPKPATTKKRRIVDNGATTSAAALAAQDEAADGLAGGISPMKTDGAPFINDAYDRTSRFSVSDKLMDAVVKVFAIHSEPNFSLPWQRRRQYASSGSGFVIPDRRILTNAHCVDYQTQVRVKRRGSDTKYLAQVLCIGAECDIAMLSIEDDAFWEELEPVRLELDLPRLQDQITVVGYPLGGDTMSVTSGVVSRIEVTSYVHGASELLGIQVDAAINSGNSGGPAFNDRGVCIGIAFQSLKSEDIENISYVIPTPVIQHFITDYETHGKYTGFPSIGVEWQKTESPTLRQALGLTTGQRGVLVRRIEPTSPANAVLSKGDVILSFNGIEIGSDGTVPFRSGERIGFSYLISQLMSGDKAMLKILHNKQVEQVEIELKPIRRLIPVHLNQQPPSYFILGGLVFTPASIPLLRSEYGKDYDFDSPIKLLEAMLHGMSNTEDEQVVILSQVLAHDINVGYEEIVNTKVSKVTIGDKETKINNLKDLVTAVESNENEEFIRFDLEYNQIVILNAKDAREATNEILIQHCIAKDRSADLLAAAVETKKDRKK